MAKRTTVVVVCDRHRGDVPATGSVEIVIEGSRTKLDLCSEHLSEFRTATRPWVRTAGSRSAASRSVGRSRADGGKASPRRSSDAAAVREWARKHGFDVPERGRLPEAVRQAYTAAASRTKKKTART